MSSTNEVGIRIIEEHEVTGELARTYDDIKAVMQTPHVPNMMKTLAVSPMALNAFWQTMRTEMTQSTLPSALVSMIHFATASQNECEYCSANNELSCRMLGIDEEILEQVVRDLDSVSPERVRAIIEFALKAAKYPKQLGKADFDHVRRYGVTDAEIVEIVFMAAMGNLGDTLADALKIDVEDATMEALAR